MSDRLRVLVIDDETDIRTIVGMNLNLAGMDFGEAENGRTALEMLRSGEWDGCILDLAMPQMDGFEVLEQARKDSTLAGIGIVVLSANATPATAIRAMELGAHAHLRKPFSPGAVAQTMFELLQLPPEERDNRRRAMMERAGELDRLGVETV